MRLILFAARWGLVLLLLPILMIYLGALILFSRTPRSAELYFSKKV